MSTAATISENTNAALPIKNENITFAVVGTVVEGKLTKVRHTSSVKDIDELKGTKEGKSVPYTGPEQIMFEQVVVKPSLGSLDGFAELIPDPEVRLDIVNKGIASKFNQKIKTILTEQNEDTSLTFQPTTASYDATALVQEEAKRVVLSPMDKAMKAVAGLDPATKALILQQLLAAQQSSSLSGEVTE